MNNELFTATNLYETKGRIPDRPLGKVSTFVVEELPACITDISALQTAVHHCLWRT